METYLTIPEELFLITVNEKTGRKASLKSRKFDLLMAGSILMELALQRRIDTDLDFIIPDLTEPTGHGLLDPAFDMIRKSTHEEKITWWLVKLAEKADGYRKILIDELVSKGLLKLEKEQVFLGFSTINYPILIRDEEVKEVKTRVRELIFSNELPELRDVVIVSVAWYGGLLNLILTEEEIEKNRDRIEQLARMDLIGQAVSKSVKSLTISVLISMRTRELLGIKSAEEKLDDLVEEMKALARITRDEDLPEWLRKGTEQYQKTLDYIRKTGTSEIVYNSVTRTYGLKAGAGQRRSF